MAEDFDSLITSFINSRLQERLKALISSSQSSLILDFQDIDGFSPDLGDYVLNHPADALDSMKHYIKEQGQIYKDLNLEVRIKNLPSSSQVLIRNIRSKHIGKLLQVSGLIKIAVSVKPVASMVDFECQSCGHIIKVEQKEKSVKQPVICPNCGKKGRFRIVEKTLIDTQRIVLEEAPEDLSGGAQPEQIDVMLEGDLVDPNFEKSIIPGNKVTVSGIVSESPIFFPSGKRSRTSEVFVKASFLESVEQGFEDIIISKEEERRIKDLSQDKLLYTKFRDSIAPNVFGYENIKDAVVLQLFGGVRKESTDKSSVMRGDLHILLCGDPGCLIGDERVVLGNGAIVKLENLGKSHLQPLNQQVLTGQGHKRAVATTFHYYKNQPVMEVVTESGRSIVGTYNHPLLTKQIVDREKPIQSIKAITKKPHSLTKKPVQIWKRLDEIKIGDELQIENWIPCTISAPVLTGFKSEDRKLGSKFRGKLPELATENMAALLGYMLGDGWVRSDKHSCGFAVSEKEVEILRPLLELAEEQFSIKPSVRKWVGKSRYHAGIKVKTAQLMYCVEIKSKDIANNLDFLAEKRVPDFILASGNRVVSQFLKWLFQADGCVVKYQSKGRKSIGFISLKSTHIELLRDVQMLLLRFSIPARIIPDDNKNGYDLVIVGADGIEKYFYYIGFATRKKQEDLKKVREVAKLITKRHHRHRFEKVVSVKPAGTRDVYDIEVPMGHRFIANGIISHNTAKSTILKFVTAVAPKARYVTGTGSSAAGLTATILKDEASRSYILEAGAMPLTNQGLLCIDELDKMNKEDRVALHEALEQQQVSISKANIHATLSAKTSVLAAANPKLGRFNPYEIIASQIDLPPTLINRFDLIFIVKDKPNPETDRLIAEKILSANKDINKNKPAVEIKLLKKYIAYSRQNCRPALSDEASKAIQEFFLKIRGQNLGENEAIRPIPISPRQLEAVIRLTEASAKVRLTQLATVEDAKRAIDLIMSYLSEVGIDKSTGELDIDRIIGGISSSQRGKILSIKSMIKAETEALPRNELLSAETVIADAEKMGMSRDDVEKAITILKQEGEIFEPKAGFIKLII
jgi:DNA replicative helicase MCM subunit Mcm2 (Cdc46/Mcm family)